MRLSLTTITDKIDRNLAVVGAIASLLLISYTAISINRAVYVLPGVLTLLACVTWLVFRKGLHYHFKLQSPSRRCMYFSPLCHTPDRK